MAVSAKRVGTTVGMEIPHFNPTSGPYLGRLMSTNRKERVYLPLKVGEANHIFILGKTGYGKTSFMKALAEALWEYYHENGREVLIVIFERKYDYSKFQRLKAYWTNLVNEAGLDYASKKHPYLAYYFEKKLKQEHLKQHLGYPGDFAMSLPNYLLENVLVSRRPYPVTLFTWHGLEAKAFKTRRIVFRPTRPLAAIKLDNGGKPVEVVVGRIPLRDISFDMLARKFDIPRGTAYGRILRKYWKVYKIHDPDEILRRVQQEENISGRTYESLKSILDEIRADPLYLKGSVLKPKAEKVEENSPEKLPGIYDEPKPFTDYLTTKRINIIDFSDNSELDLEEQRLIMYLLWQKIKLIAGRNRVDVWIFFDEIQDLIGTAGEASRHNLAWKAIEEIYRKGRSLSINVVAGTQYLYKLPMSLIMGAAHIAVIGALASPKDLDILRVAIMDGDRLRIPVEHGSFEEFMKRRRKKGRGWFSFDREFTVKMYFRPNQSF
ncbi:DUF87 domain-containing protein [Thermococcus sp. 9N3]|uniref:helicase HerA domain-containing protein n=1 Tax=Thermococcus sp. 9N3 TaxID=163002 RepID=UPI0014311F28|nr:DUF87 domain-containing protein [Thermococcus sp. 9N3]NJE48405.1 DUF87 domain-containing protein [Thermococcus sp. 9N3]